MKQESSKVFSFSSIMGLVLSLALALGMCPLSSVQDAAFAEELPESEISDLEANELDSDESGDIGQAEGIEPVVDKQEVVLDDVANESEFTGTEATYQKENSFRYTDGVPVSTSDADGMQGRDVSLMAGADTYIPFGQGPCPGYDAGKGIDVSQWQGNIDWGKVKLSGVNFAILKCASGVSLDPQFARNVQGCRSAGMRFGVYYYTYATDPSQGKTDAQRVISQLNAQGITPGELSFPIYYDLEDDVLLANMNASQLSDLAWNFVVELRNAGYSKIGIYSNMDWWTNKLTAPYFKSADLFRWVAQYNSTGLGWHQNNIYKNHPFSDFRSRGDVWQFSSSGRVGGISGNVDLNYSYYNMIGDAQDGAMFRLYNPNSGEHFYTASAYEGNHLIDVGWRYEGIAWIAPSKSNTPVYRMYNPNAGDHHYTTNAYERDSLIRSGWRYEGIGWYSDDAKRTTLLRLYNPNARAGAHHYTTNAYERDSLVRSGWRFEGIAWHGL